ncbi:MAG: hypothetical protein C4330_10660 [Chitinophagaceae bacterium]
MLVAIIAYAPVSSMLYSLKNDIIELEYPIKFFISDSLHNGSSALWFNTWAMGFPLQSIITWSIFSPPGFLFALIPGYNLYALHIEFVFYIFFAGTAMYALLRRHCLAEVQVALTLSVCYMLSGFMVGSSQWLLYITAAGFIPIVFNMLLNLLKKPSWRHALLFAAAFYCMLTSTYVAFSIITVYLLLFVAAYYLYDAYSKNEKHFTNCLSYLIISSIVIILLCLPCLFSSIDVINHIERGKPIANGGEFFNTNYLPWQGFISLLGAAAVVHKPFTGTEATMMDLYIGLLPLLLLPVSIVKNIKEGNKINNLITASILLFALLALGHQTPLRNWFNILPGFSYFRNAGLFRLFAIMGVIVLLGRTLNKNFWFHHVEIKKRIFYSSMAILTLGYLIMLIHNWNSFSYQPNSLKSFIQNISNETTLLVTAIIQLPILLFIGFAWYYKKQKMLTAVVSIDLIVNTLICLPFFTVSSYSVRDVSNILKIEKGYPVQNVSPSKVRTNIQFGTSAWHNVNIYQKLVSTRPSSWGPLVLKSFKPSDTADSIQKQVVYANANTNTQVKVLQQNPDGVKAVVTTGQPTTIYFTQNRYAGWNAYLNKKEIKITEATSGMKVIINESGILEFKYRRSYLRFAAIFINALVLLFFLSLFLLKIYSIIFPRSVREMASSIKRSA